MAEHQGIAERRSVAASSLDRSPSGYFDAVSARFRRAHASAGGPVERSYRISNRTVQFRFAGSALVDRITPALEHLAARGAGEPDLCVSLWDSASTGITMLPPPWQAGELRVNGEIPSFIEKGFYAHYNVYHNALTLFDREARNAIYWIRDAEDVPDHETASPLFALFQSWVTRFGTSMVHAAAVGLPEGGALLVGECGSGKSNTSLACLGSDLLHAGDDRCLVSAEPEPYVHSLYSTAKTHPEDVRRFPFLEGSLPRLRYLQSGKALYMLQELFPEKLTSGFPLRAILLPNVTGRRDTTLAPGSPAAGLRMLAPYAMLRWPSTAKSSFQTLSELFNVVPCYRLELGTDRRQIPATILKLLRS